MRWHAIGRAQPHFLPVTYAVRQNFRGADVGQWVSSMQRTRDMPDNDHWFRAACDSVDSADWNDNLGEIRETFEEARADAERFERDHGRSCTVINARRDGSRSDPGFWKENERIDRSERFRDR